MIHKPWLLAGSPSVWAGLDLRVLLLHETSTAVPAPGDEYVAALSPGTNELVNDDYTRTALTGLGVAWNGTTGRYELQADDVDFGALTPDPGTQGVSGWALYVHVTDDDDSRLVMTDLETPMVLNGDHLLLPWPDGIVMGRGED